MVTGRIVVLPIFLVILNNYFASAWVTFESDFTVNADDDLSGIPDIVTLFGSASNSDMLRNEEGVDGSSCLILMTGDGENTMGSAILSDFSLGPSNVVSSFEANWVQKLSAGDDVGVTFVYGDYSGELWGVNGPEGDGIIVLSMNSIDDTLTLLYDGEITDTYPDAGLTADAFINVRVLVNCDLNHFTLYFADVLIFDKISFGDCAPTGTFGFGAIAGDSTSQNAYIDDVTIAVDLTPTDRIYHMTVGIVVGGGLVFAFAIAGLVLYRDKLFDWNKLYSKA